MVIGRFFKIGHNAHYHAEEENHIDKECVYLQEMEENHVKEKKLRRKIVMSNLVMNWMEKKALLSIYLLL
jgi:hypothetical protein